MKKSKSILTVAVTAAICLLFSAGETHAANGDCGVIVTGGVEPLASDCEGILRHAVSDTACAPWDPCVCDTNGSGAIFASDALLCLKVAVGIPAFSLACDCGVVPTSSTSSTSMPSVTVTTTTTTLPVQPPLVAGDFPAVSPCSGRDTLPENPDFLAVMLGAKAADHVVQFTQYDTQGLPEICGLGTADNALAPGAVAWDPSRINEIVICHMFETNVEDFFLTVPLGHGPELCQTGNDTATLAMPRAGTYRKDVCIEHGGNAYDARTRLTVEGASADQTFSSLGIARGDLKTCSGTTEIVTVPAARAFVAESPRQFDVAIRTGSCSGGTHHLDLTAEIICVKKRTAACPEPHLPCFWGR